MSSCCCKQRTLLQVGTGKLLLPGAAGAAWWSLSLLLFSQNKDSLGPELRQWVQLVVWSCGDHLPTASRLAVAEVLTSTTPLFLTSPQPILGKCANRGPCTQLSKHRKRHTF